jgi:hypothetical protein
MAEGGPGATHDVVAALRAVPGVVDASITPDRRLGGAGTLHLTLQPGADEVAVANAVNQVLREHFGLAVDTDNVSIVDEAVPTRLSSVPPAPNLDLPGLGPQPARPPAALTSVPWLAEDDVDDASARASGAPPDQDVESSAMEDLTEPEEGTQDADQDAGSQPEAVPRGPRLLIERMQLVAADLGVETEVTLGFGGGHWTGHADGAATPSSVHRAVAVATLDAVAQSVDHTMRLELEHLAVPPLGSEHAVVVEVSLVTRRGAERLTGVSAVREDVRQAVIRATLDALNRRLESVLVPA